ncbi:MAG: hypothetical protein KatS3mg053_3823 [Candidatus Roseilinea sp.]|nr:MAG: hypothetical protein KatS3mg053_3823 [Candidatus Roseilinea sp.]GIV84766.1 MAG: hypothetical protein KatS3mg052_1773 [Candidatus Roseilinea sp.]
MTELATLEQDFSLRLPKEIARYFQPSDRFMVWRDGDTLVLKRVVPSVTKIVEQAPLGEPMPLDQINAIVHEARRQRHADNR